MVMELCRLLDLGSNHDNTSVPKAVYFTAMKQLLSVVLKSDLYSTTEDDKQLHPQQFYRHIANRLLVSGSTGW